MPRSLRSDRGLPQTAVLMTHDALGLRDCLAPVAVVPTGVGSTRKRTLVQLCCYCPESTGSVH